MAISLKQARRAYMRGVYGTKDECYWRARAEAAVMAYDAGEFSGQILHDAAMAREEKLLAAVAQAAGVHPNLLHEAMYHFDMHEEDAWRRAHGISF